MLATATFTIASPVTCTGTITPKVTITNIGTSAITAATISYYFGTNAPTTYDWSGNLAVGATSASIDLPAAPISTGTFAIKGNVSLVNGTPFNGQGAIVNTIVFPSALSFGPSIASPIVQDFNLITFPPAGWGLNNPNGSTTWARSGSVGAYNVSPFGSGKYPFSAVTGDVDELYVPNFDFSDVNQSSAYMEFDYAKAKKNGHNDQLLVMASSDCGATWTTLFDQTDNTTLSTATSSSTSWVPTAAQWKSVDLDMTSFIGQANVYVKFKTVSGFGNSLFIDNVNIHYGSPVGINEPTTSSLLLYPNPANDFAVVHVNGVIPSYTKLEVLNTLGQVVYSAAAKSNVDLTINTLSLNNGMYLYRLNSNGKILALDKFNVSH